MNEHRILGLKNFGNTCYLNSILQCLLNISNFGKNIEWISSDTSISNQLKFIHEKTDICTTLLPGSICKYIKHDTKLFNVMEQNDAHEFLNYLLNNIHEEHKNTKYEIPICDNILFNILTIVNKIQYEKTNECPDKLLIDKLLFELKLIFDKDYYSYIIYKKYTLLQKYYKNEGKSIISDKFLGFYKNIIICDQCKINSSTCDNFITIPIDINKKSIEECFNNFCQVETLRDDNKYYCENCKEYTNATKKISFIDMPNNLIINLKRFMYVKKNNNIIIKKNKKIINFDLDKLSIDIGHKICEYNLTSVCSHYGTCNYGHYISFVKKNNIWYRVDDDFVIPEQDLPNIIKNAYILFYEKI